MNWNVTPAGVLPRSMLIVGPLTNSLAIGQRRMGLETVQSGVLRSSSKVSYCDS